MPEIHKKIIIIGLLIHTAFLKPAQALCSLSLINELIFYGVIEKERLHYLMQIKIIGLISTDLDRFRELQVIFFHVVSLFQGEKKKRRKF